MNEKLMKRKSSLIAAVFLSSLLNLHAFAASPCPTFYYDKVGPDLCPDAETITETNHCLTAYESTLQKKIARLTKEYAVRNGILSKLSALLEIGDRYSAMTNEQCRLGSKITGTSLPTDFEAYHYCYITLLSDRADQLACR